jgi:predicted dehydrogenase
MHQGVTDFDDTGVVNLRFSRGAIGAIHFTTNSYRKNMEGSLTIFGEKGTFKIGGEYLNKVVYQELEGGSVEISDLTNEANDYGSYTGSMSNHGLFYNNVIDVLEHGAAMTTNADQAHQTVELIERIYAARYDS